LTKDVVEAGQWYRKGAGTGDRFALYFRIYPDAERLKTLGE